MEDLPGIHIYCIAGGPVKKRNQPVPYSGNINDCSKLDVKSPPFPLLAKKYTPSRALVQQGWIMNGLHTKLPGGENGRSPRLVFIETIEYGINPDLLHLEKLTKCRRAWGPTGKPKVWWDCTNSWAYAKNTAMGGAIGKMMPVEDPNGKIICQWDKK